MEMEAKELMIGDIVMWHDVKHIIDGTDFTTWKPDGVYEKASMDFSPIPLTPEILEKNGFSDSARHGLKVLEFDDYRIFANYAFINIYSKSCRESTIKLHSTKFYVHQLQRALRCCGLCDLANNFVI